MSIRVFLVDDHTIFRCGIRALLDGTEGVEVTGEAGSGREALEALQTQEVDVLLLDITMPDMSGVDVARALSVTDDPPGILVLSMHDDEAYLREFLALGARGYVLKSSTGEELLRAITAVHNGDSHVDTCGHININSFHDLHYCNDYNFNPHSGADNYTDTDTDGHDHGIAVGPPRPDGTRAIYGSYSYLC